MDIFTDKIVTESFAMDYFRFGSGERAFVILPGLSRSEEHTSELQSPQ